MVLLKERLDVIVESHQACLQGPFAFQASFSKKRSLVFVKTSPLIFLI